MESYRCISFPRSKTCLAVCVSLKSLKLVLWYHGDYFLNTGSVLEIDNNEYIVNGRQQELDIFKITPLCRSNGISI
jgi:hypothetical protein